MDVRIASAPVSFGVDEVQDGAFRPDPDEVLAAIAGLGLEGTELGPTGFLGTPAATRERLVSHDLALVGAYFPLHFGRPELFAKDFAWLQTSLGDLRRRTPADSQPMAILGDGFTDPQRVALAGIASDHPEAWLDDRARTLFIDDVHRAAEACRNAGFDAVVHPHVGTYLETDEEVRWAIARLDPELVGLCLDTGHVLLGGGDPVALARDMGSLVRHVHLKDVAPDAPAWLRAHRPGLRRAMEHGVFCELGQGTLDLEGVFDVLDKSRYRGWVVLEQDRRVGADTSMALLTDGVARNLAVVSAGLAGT